MSAQKNATGAQRGLRRPGGVRRSMQCEWAGFEGGRSLHRRLHGSTPQTRRVLRIESRLSTIPRLNVHIYSLSKKYASIGRELIPGIRHSGTAAISNTLAPGAGVDSLQMSAKKERRRASVLVKPGGALACRQANERQSAEQSPAHAYTQNRYIHYRVGKVTVKCSLVN